MIRPISLFSYFFILLFFSNCKKEAVGSKFDYNQKANQVIQQLIIDNECDCILEIPKESLIELSLSDNPKFDVQKKAITELHLKNKTELDSLEKLGNNFILDSTFLNRQKIKVIKRDSLREKIDDILFYKKCKKGIISIIKPIFDKNFKTALTYSKTVPTCIGSYPDVYIYENGNWRRK